MFARHFEGGTTEKSAITTTDFQQQISHRVNTILKQNNTFRSSK
jgi:hypothetical protein